MTKPSIPKGTRDFSPEEMRKRNFIFDTLKSVFQVYGYQQIETPSMENLSTLLGKYGEEGDKLLFRILNSGDFLGDFNNFEIKNLEEKWNLLLSRISIEKNPKKAFFDEIKKINQDRDGINYSIGKYFSDEKDKILEKIKNVKSFEGLKKYLKRYRYKYLKKKLQSYKKDSAELVKGICEKGLRYDLTVPFARYVVQYRDTISFPFKRYQMQPVWRADRPQKGRYREFYQCDVDVVGSDSLLNEAELIQIIDEGFKRLGIRVIIKLNNRKILSGIAEIIGQPDKITDITVAIDKLEKIGLEKVNGELRERGISEDAIVKLQPLFALSGTNDEKLTKLKTWISSSEIGLKGIEELQTVFEYVKKVEINTPIELDLTLARGLNYYTGAIFEIKSAEVEIGSICGGGRYDNLTGIFGLPGVSGVGISFGADRIYDVLNQLNVFPADSSQSTQILFINFGPKEEIYCMPLVQKLRGAGIKAELFPGSEKMKKQMAYANAKKIPYVALVGEEEMNQGVISLKDMASGEQAKISFDALVEKLKPGV